MRRASALAAVLGSAVAYNNGAPHSKLPPLGWSSWVALGPGQPGPNAAHPVFDYCDEASVKASIDAFHTTGLYGAGYRHFHLDDCWADVDRNATGFLVPETDHFPNGMKTVVDYAHSKDLVFGLYTCAGTKTCVGGRPGSKDHWEQDAAVWAEWGVDWVKMDWCNTHGMTPETTYPLMSAALNKTGRAIHFNMCEWGRDNPWEWGPAVAQSWRATGDHIGLWSSTKSVIDQRTAIPQSQGGAAYAWNDMDMLETGNYEQAAHANGRESNMSAIEYKTEFSMWAIFASPLVVTTPLLNCTPAKPATPPVPPKVCSVALTKQNSKAGCEMGKSFGCTDGTSNMWTAKGCRGVFTCNGVKDVACDVDGGGNNTCVCQAKPEMKCVASITALQKEILLNTEVIAINQDLTPTGMLIAKDDGHARVYARNLTGGDVAVALYNPEDEAQPATVNFAALGLSSTAEYRVRDLWAHKDVGKFAGTYSPGSVDAHATVVVRIQP